MSRRITPEVTMKSQDSFIGNNPMHEGEPVTPGDAGDVPEPAECSKGFLCAIVTVLLVLLAGAGAGLGVYFTQPRATPVTPLRPPPRLEVPQVTLSGSIAGFTATEFAADPDAREALGIAVAGSLQASANGIIMIDVTNENQRSQLRELQSRQLQQVGRAHFQVQLLLAYRPLAETIEELVDAIQTDNETIAATVASSFNTQMAALEAMGGGTPRPRIVSVTITSVAAVITVPEPSSSPSITASPSVSSSILGTPSSSTSRRPSPTPSITRSPRPTPSTSPSVSVSPSASAPLPSATPTEAPFGLAHVFTRAEFRGGALYTDDRIEDQVHVYDTNTWRHRSLPRFVDSTPEDKEEVSDLATHPTLALAALVTTSWFAIYDTRVGHEAVIAAGRQSGWGVDAVAAFHPTQPVLYIMSRNGGISMVNATHPGASAQLVMAPAVRNDRLRAQLVVGPHGTTLAHTYSNTVTLVSTASWTQVASAELRGFVYDVVHWPSEQAYLVVHDTNSSDSAAVVTLLRDSDLQFVREIAELPTGSKVRDVAFHIPSSNLFLAVDATVMAIDLSTVFVSHMLRRHQKRIQRIACHESRLLLATVAIGFSPSHPNAAGQTLTNADDWDDIPHSLRDDDYASADIDYNIENLLWVDPLASRSSDSMPAPSPPPFRPRSLVAEWRYACTGTSDCPRLLGVATTDDWVAVAQENPSDSSGAPFSVEVRSIVSGNLERSWQVAERVVGMLVAADNTSLVVAYASSNSIHVREHSRSSNWDSVRHTAVDLRNASASCSALMDDTVFEVRELAANASHAGNASACCAMCQSLVTCTAWEWYPANMTCIPLATGWSPVRRVGVQSGWATRASRMRFIADPSRTRGLVYGAATLALVDLGSMQVLVHPSGSDVAGGRMFLHHDEESVSRAAAFDWTGHGIWLSFANHSAVRISASTAWEAMTMIGPFVRIGGLACDLNGPRLAIAAPRQGWGADPRDDAIPWEMHVYEDEVEKAAWIVGIVPQVMRFSPSEDLLVTSSPFSPKVVLIDEPSRNRSQLAASNGLQTTATVVERWSPPSIPTQGWPWIWLVQDDGLGLGDVAFSPSGRFLAGGSRGSGNAAQRGGVAQMMLMSSNER